MSLNVIQTTLYPTRRDGQIEGGGVNITAGGGTGGGGVSVNGGGGSIIYDANWTVDGDNVYRSVGFVGIGIVPTVPLHIAKTGTTKILVTHTGVSSWKLESASNGTTWFMGVVHDRDLQIGRNATADMTIKNTTGEVQFAGDLNSPTFTSGFAGSGWKMDLNTDYTLTVDNLVVRKALTVYELQINKINSINGGILISVANGTCYSAVWEAGGYILYFDEDNGNKQIQFIVGDAIKAQIWTGRGVASFKGVVATVTHSNTYGEAHIHVTSTDTAWNNMELVQCGHDSNAARQNMIYITASDTYNPYIDVLAGVMDNAVFTDKTKVRLGNLTGITDAELGALSGYGLWSDNVYLTGKLVLPNAGMTDEEDSDDAIRIYAGETYANRHSAPFRVTDDGSLTAIGVAEFGTAVDGSGTNVAIMGPYIWENSLNDDGSGIFINYRGYNNTSDHYRNFAVYDGKTNPLITANGSSTPSIDLWAPKVAVGGQVTNSWAALDIQSTSRALILPKLTNDAVTTMGGNATIGMLIFNTTANEMQVYTATNGWRGISMT